MCGAKILALSSACPLTMTHFFSRTELSTIDAFKQTCLGIPLSQVLAEIPLLLLSRATLRLAALQAQH